MAEKFKIEYKKIDEQDVKVIYSSDKKQTEVIARVAKPGTYHKCSSGVTRSKASEVPAATSCGAVKVTE